MRPCSLHNSLCCTCHASSDDAAGGHVLRWTVQESPDLLRRKFSVMCRRRCLSPTSAMLCRGLEGIYSAFLKGFFYNGTFPERE